MSEHSVLACAIYELASAVRSHSDDPCQSRPATKGDLVELEDNLSDKLADIRAAILHGSSQITPEDQSVLDKSREFLRQLALRVEQIDAAHPAPVSPSSTTT
jgi:hypothetical protein